MRINQLMQIRPATEPAELPTAIDDEDGGEGDIGVREKYIMRYTRRTRNKQYQSSVSKQCAVTKWLAAQNVPVKSLEH